MNLCEYRFHSKLIQIVFIVLFKIRYVFMIKNRC